MQPIYLSKSITPLTSNGIGTISSGVTTATLNSSFVIDTQRRVALSTSAGTDLTGATFTIVGTREGGGKVSETIAGSTGTTIRMTLSDFLTVTSITASSGVNVPAIFGTSSQAGTPWKMVNWQCTPIELAAGITMSSGAVAATCTATIEHTFDDPTGTYPNLLAGANGSTLAGNIGVPSVWTSTSLSGINPGSGLPFWSPFPSDTFAPTAACAAYRLTITSTAASGTVFATVVQAGIG